MNLLLFIFIQSVLANNQFDFDLLYGNLGPKTPPQESEKAVKDLIQRLIGEKATFFQVNVDPKLAEDHKDSFKIKKFKDYVKIEGSSGVAASWGFHYFLKEYCHCHISWDGDQLKLPEPLPDVDTKVVANDWFRYYQNVCTTSYSFVWWDWERWQREIDWMALNGYNLALAFTGQEEIWRRVYLKLGMTDEEINQHFSGPAFLSWNRMGNMRGWGGPLSTAWHNSSVVLQKQILQRMRELGITPVLPSFAGHVPRAFSRIFPDTNVSLLPDWCNFQDQYCCPYLLSPENPRFIEVGSLFLKEYIAEFGTDHIYNCDPFNEMLPSSEDLDYLRRIGQSIYKVISTMDPSGIWMLQGWLFKHDFLYWSSPRVEAFLTSVPIGKILVLDLQAELIPQYPKFNSFFGQPFIWCMLHNFGGTLGLHGSSEFINNNIFEARQFRNSSMVGVGIAPEGINQNYVIYDLMMDMFWRNQPTNLTEWFNNYARRRYGVSSIHAERAWNLLKQSVYNYTGVLSQHGKYIVIQHPKLNLSPDNLWYEEDDVYEAWSELLKASSNMLKAGVTETFLIDLVDLTRQALQLKLSGLFGKIQDAYWTGNLTDLQETSKMFLDILDDLETILASNSKFLLGKWLNDAKKVGKTPLEKKILERNARNQITLWGPNGEIRDYASKQWSGLIKDYYKPRWQIFLSALNETLAEHKSFRQNKVSIKIFSEVEEHFTYSYNNYTDKPIGDSIAISHSLYQKLRRI